MVTDRTYRQALSISTALMEIERGSGRQFDPGLVTPFVDIVSRNRFPAMYEEQAGGR
jgi:response regulator RpfG family c-di-GMP phosphodiesterase